MATPENTFIAGVHKHLDESVYRMKNNNIYNAGIADVWYSGRARDLWVEYKFAVLPKRGTTFVVPGLSELQKKWLRERHTEGRNVAVIVGCKEGAIILRNPVAWEGGVTAATFRATIISRRTAAETIGRFVHLS